MSWRCVSKTEENNKNVFINLVADKKWQFLEISHMTQQVMNTVLYFTFKWGEFLNSILWLEAIASQSAHKFVRYLVIVNEVADKPAKSRPQY